MENRPSFGVGYAIPLGFSLSIAWAGFCLLFVCSNMRERMRRCRFEQSVARSEEETVDK